MGFYALIQSTENNEEPTWQPAEVWNLDVKQGRGEQDKFDKKRIHQGKTGWCPMWDIYFSSRYSLLFTLWQVLNWRRNNKFTGDRLFHCAAEITTQTLKSL